MAREALIVALQQVTGMPQGATSIRYRGYRELQQHSRGLTAHNNSSTVTTGPLKGATSYRVARVLREWGRAEREQVTGWGV